MDSTRIQNEILKVDTEQRIAYGWASVIEKDGAVVVDHQGDMIGEPDLVNAAHKYVLDERAGKVMHNGKRIADVVESMVFTKQLQQTLGIDMKKVGWFIALKVRDEETWKMIKEGKLTMFSIGGIGRREDAQ